MNFKKLLGTGFAVSAMMLGASQAQARGAFGIDGGYGFETPTPTNKPTYNFGLSYEGNIGAVTTLGIFGSYQLSKKTTIGGQSSSTTHIPLGVDLDYHMGMPGFYIGVNAGYDLATMKVLGTSEHSNKPFIGGELGFDFMLSGSTTLGLEGRYLYILATSKDSLIQGLLNLKFMF